MRRKLFYAICIAISLQMYSVSVNAVAVPVVSANVLADSSASVSNSLVFRLNEIKAMDKSTLTRSEKKSLRKEVKSIKKELKATSNGVYISVGAIIIILLLLIILL